MATNITTHAVYQLSTSFVNILIGKLNRTIGMKTQETKANATTTCYIITHLCFHSLKPSSIHPHIPMHFYSHDTGINSRTCRLLNSSLFSMMRECYEAFSEILTYVFESLYVDTKKKTLC